MDQAILHVHGDDATAGPVFLDQVEADVLDEEFARMAQRLALERMQKGMADAVGSSTGPLHRPKLPGVPGIESFVGHCFHTSRWDYDYTGGDPGGAPLDKLADKRVGIIGTGATAIQVIAEIADTVPAPVAS